jgi:hypothetical protein
MFRGVTAVFAAALTCVGLAGPAAAPASAYVGAINIDNGVYVEGCSEVDYEYFLDIIGTYYSTYDVEIIVLDEAGSAVPYHYASGGPRSDKGTLAVCAAGPGSFHVDTKVTSCTATQECVTQAGPSNNFGLDKPQTRTSLTASAIQTRYNQVVTFRIVRRNEYVEGKFHRGSGKVRLQVQLRNERWMTVRGSRVRADSNGRAVLRYRVPGTLLKIRAATVEPDFYASYSDPVVLR